MLPHAPSLARKRLACITKKETEFKVQLLRADCATGIGLW
jgi:hypothetical protein